jgi:hypothetical protein
MPKPGDDGRTHTRGHVLNTLAPPEATRFPLEKLSLRHGTDTYTFDTMRDRRGTGTQALNSSSSIPRHDSPLTGRES